LFSHSEAQQSAASAKLQLYFFIHCINNVFGLYSIPSTLITQ